MTKNHNLFRHQHIFCCCLLFLTFIGPLSAQDLMVSGKVTDGQLPISGANILIKNTNSGVVTDFDGRFTITARPSDTLQISYLGYTTLTIPINNRSTINVTLQEDATALGEVQINAGYYSTTDREKTGSIARITAKDIELQPVNNPLGAMQGYMSGVNIVQNTGVPGGGYDIQIRGKNFINGGTDPLFIVDGVPYGSESLGSIAISVGINQGNTSPLNAINPNDIESIEVLKDADATAIYGSRAANGVVLITTKKGKQGKTEFNINMSSSLGTVSHFLDLLNTEQYLRIRREAIINDGRYDIENPAYDFIWPDVKTWDQNRYTDWQEELIGGTAYRKNLQLSVSGGSERTRFLISGSHQNETTVFPGDSRYKKIFLHNTLNHQSKNQRFKINLSTVYSIEDNRLPRTDLTSKAYTTEPNAPALYDGNGQLNWENNTFDNPLAVLEEKYQADVNTLIMNAGVAYQIMPSLELKTSLGYTTYNLSSYRILPNTARLPSYGFTPETYSNITTNGSERTSWIVEPQLNWHTQYGKLKLNALLGATFQHQNTDQLVLNGRGFPNNSLLLNLAAAKTITVMEDSDSKYAYQAFFGRVNFNWEDRYLLNLTGRRDGSSRFGSGKQFGNFGAIGAAWLFSEEELFNFSSILSFGKLRGSFGTTGSDNIGDYKFLDTYKITGADYDGVTVLEPNGILNSEFGWESNQKLETALELGFFNNRLILNSAWYKNRSSNQLIGIPLAHTTGFSELTGNFNATVENTGLEFDVISRNINRSSLKWTTVFNLTIPKNKLVKFPSLETSTFANKLIIGKPVTIKHLYHALGVDPETGVYQFKDYNNDGVINSSGDKKWIEDLSPEFFGGLGNTLTYKNLKLDIFFQFKKQKAYNLFRSVVNPGYRRNIPKQLLDYWQNPGDTTPIMQATMGYNSSLSSSISQQQSSNAAVSDASFIRLRNVTLSYQVPQNMLPAIDLSFYLQGQNLLTITSYDGPDPETFSMNILPPLRQITLGAQIRF
ncbi:SusC/RagA family TonB-linked outer membrane protein [Gelidibacter japonicus]|uniref:SusC/RagA family TonB-linked outer membrane protein n=1 Tax=Gelidibacter japonicus TaxID=1962232 RepID=UPI002AFE3D05|nr:SusC/RagA family TonB-linked outer membrane protein [Gelidibacter japonicus]